MPKFKRRDPGRMEDIPIDDLRKVFSYNSATGQFTWLIDNRCRNPNGRRVPGDIAGSLDGSGYVQIIGLGGRRIRAHRLAWAFVHGEWPALHIDHIDCDKGNNRIENLRQATNAQNIANQGLRKDNRAGVKGVRKHRNRWVAECSSGGVTKYIGSFLTPEEAHSAYCEKAKEIHGEFWRAS